MMVTITEKDREEAIRCYIRKCSKCAICTPPSFGHCGGRSAQSGRESSRDIECNQRSREVPVRITEWGSTTPVT